MPPYRRQLIEVDVPLTLSTPSRPGRSPSAGKTAMYDFNRLRDEIIRNLRNDGGDVTVAVMIRADQTDGFSEGITRAVRENSAQLKIYFSASDYAPEGKPERCRCPADRGQKKRPRNRGRRPSGTTRWGGCQ